MTIKLSAEQTNFIEWHGAKVGDDWFHLPLWYHKVGENLFEQVTFEKLPDHVKNMIMETREREVTLGDENLSNPNLPDGYNYY